MTTKPRELPQQISFIRYDNSTRGRPCARKYPLSAKSGEIHAFFIENNIEFSSTEKSPRSNQILEAIFNVLKTAVFEELFEFKLPRRSKLSKKKTGFKRTVKKSFMGYRQPFDLRKERQLIFSDVCFDRFMKKHKAYLMRGVIEKRNHRSHL